MSAIKPNAAFKYVRADEVAECWEGVTRDLYAKLWNDIVPLQKPMPNVEDNGPHDVIGIENLASHWDKLDPEDQTLLNRLAEARAAEYAAFDRESGGA